MTTFSKLFLLVLSISFLSCGDDSETKTLGTPLEIQIPEGFPEMQIPSDNPTTVEGVALGRKLFYDPILSSDSTISCANCHLQGFSFSDRNRFSFGVGGQVFGGRNAPNLVNAGWGNEFFWDGRAFSLENQALGPVVNPKEMQETWVNVAEKLKNHSTYPELFEEVFGDVEIDSSLVTKAIAQFERTFISANSKYDKLLRDEEQFSTSEESGKAIFEANCSSCHIGILFTDNEFHNNGIDSVLADLGRKEVTGKDEDLGKFKTPSLRNVEVSWPYFHDGRFNTLEEVIGIYAKGGLNSETVDARIAVINLDENEQSDLITFLKTLTDEEFINNENLKNPF